MQIKRILIVGSLTFLAGTEAESAGAHYTDLTADFVRFFDATAGMEEQSRVALFRERMDPLLPGFYTPRTEKDAARYDSRVAGALKAFPELRPRYEQVQREFAKSFELGIQHFRKEFSGFTPNVPVYLLHSLGEMDGGMRTFDGKNYLVFGADVIARIHETRTITPFLDHELFHVEHRKHFEGCEEAWCALWTEGLATYAAKTMNPGADDEQLLLTRPKPIRPAVDATWPAAACFVRARLTSTADEDMRTLFFGGPDDGEFPRRFGYYVGLRAIDAMDGQYSLRELAQMPQERAKTVLSTSIDLLIQKAGGCPASKQ